MHCHDECGSFHHDLEMSTNKRYSSSSTLLTVAASNNRIDSFLATHCIEIGPSVVASNLMILAGDMLHVGKVGLFVGFEVGIWV
eukprot:CCRYP_019721-RB/>CCRYP_019721-RB protein AED:0.67 eAED:0.90 QI:0/0/0/0.66/0/0/3/0/83